MVDVLGVGERKSLPTMHELMAALVAGGCVDESGSSFEDLRASYPRVPTDGRFRDDYMVEGETLLIELGFLQVDGSRVIPTRRLRELLLFPVEFACEILLSEFLEDRRPLWLDLAASTGELLAEVIPDEDTEALATIISDPLRREAFLLGLAQRVDLDRRRELGERGEVWVQQAYIALLNQMGRPELAAKVVRVSLVSDALGYDLTVPCPPEQSLRIEVKTTTDAENLSFFISRNEFEVGRRDIGWRLVVCVLDGNGEIFNSYWGLASNFLSVAPQEVSKRGRWASLRMSLPRGILKMGLPPYDSGVS
jgi:hypothetical protein